MFPDNEIDSSTNAVAAALGSAEIDYSGRNVLLSHQFYSSAGITPVLSESEVNPVGGLDAVDAAMLSRFDYAALGHLHGGQNAGCNARYAGSPVKYSFSERKQEKSATLVTLRGKGDTEITTLPFTPLRDMREIRGPLDILTSEEVYAQNSREDYLRVVLTDEEEIIDPLGKLRAVYPNVMVLDYENARAARAVSPVLTDEGQVETLTAYDLFSEFFLESSGAVMTEAQAEIVRELLAAGADA
jgi:exonuclease SbcD